MKKFSVPLTAMYTGQVEVVAADEEMAFNLAVAMINTKGFDAPLEYLKGSLRVEEDDIYEVES